MIINKSVKRYTDLVASMIGINKQAAYIAYINYWMFIKETIEGLPDLENITEEEFNKLRCNFNILKIGKFTTNYKKIRKTVKHNKIINERISNKKN